MKDRELQLGYIPALDGLRAFSCLLIIVFHTDGSWIKGAAIAVNVFFVLSGFLITALLLQEFERNNVIDFKAFYLRRIRRLAPAMLLLVSVFALFTVTVCPERAALHFREILISLSYVANWIKAFQLYPMDYLAHTWTLSVEEQFYILFPALFAMLLRSGFSHRAVMLCLALVIVAVWINRIILTADGAPYQRLYNGLDTRADSLLAGCLLGLFWMSQSTRKRYGRRVAELSRKCLPAAQFLFVVMLFSVNVKRDYMYYGWFFLVDVLVVIFVLAALLHKDQLLPRTLSHPLMVWLGKLSYGMYLWHWPVILLLQRQGLVPIEVLAACVPLTILLAAVSYYGVECRFLRGGKRERDLALEWLRSIWGAICLRWGLKLARR